MTRTQTRSFDGWTLRLDIGELEKDGRRIRLQDQPLQVLDELLSRPGEVVTREELIARLWPKGVVDFDTGINSSVRKVRVALDDVGETPRYIETLPRKGYRFIGSLDPPPAEPALPAPQVSPNTDPRLELPSPLPLDGPGHPTRRSWRTYLYAMAGVAVLAGIAVSYLDWGVSERTASQIDSNAGEELDAHTLAVLPLRTAASAEADLLLAQSVTDLIRNRLADFKNMVVIASTSSPVLATGRDGLRASSGKLHARYLVTGGIERAASRLYLDIQLIDASSGKQLWQSTFDRPFVEMAQIREEIFRNVAAAVKATVDTRESDAAAPAPLSLEAYQAYMRGQKLMANETAEDVGKAVELFRRATVLDPGFARAYLALGQAQWLAFDLGGQVAPDLRLAASNAVERALELNPAMGEAWIERARRTRDVQEAEAQYRKGLAYSPNYGKGYSYYSDFLFVENRLGEAIETIERARAIDPLVPDLYLNQAFMEIVSRSDVAAHDRLVLQALEVNPEYQPALRQLAESRWEYSGEFADAARIIERAIALDPQSEDSRTIATHVYLDLGDPRSAIAAQGAGHPLSMEILQFQRDRRSAAELLRELPASSLWFGGAFAIEAEALRDDALLNRNYGPALARLEAAYATRPTARPLMWSRYQAIIYAHVLTLAGQVERGRKLAASTLVMLDTQSVGRKEGWLSRERAASYMVLGEKERALQELSTAVKAKRLYRWWYTFELDPLFEPLHEDPRFVALREEAKSHCEHQRALLEELRSKGEVPRHTS